MCGASDDITKEVLFGWNLPRWYGGGARGDTVRANTKVIRVCVWQGCLCTTTPALQVTPQRTVT